MRWCSDLELYRHPAPGQAAQLLAAAGQGCQDFGCLGGMEHLHLEVVI
jgi:hypothetical protein